MARVFKNKVTNLPYIGYLARVLVGVAKGPRVRDQVNSQLAEILKHQGSQQEKLEHIAQNVNKMVAEGKLAAQQNKQHAKEVDDAVSAIQHSQDNLQHALEQLQIKGVRPTTKTANQERKTDLFADKHELDVFYALFEDRFRGTEELITERLREYLPLFKKSGLDFNKTPVLDIGCGRGEFLQLLNSTAIKAIGLDINHDMVKRAKAKGLHVVQGDAVAHLEQSPPQKYGAITGFHLVEHMPFEVLMKLFAAAHKSLVHGGFVLFETPNPENVTVGSAGFYMDPSHLNPLPPALLSFALEVCGFRKIDIKRLHPAVEPENSNLPPQISNYFYGPLDYAVIGYK